MTTDPNTHTQNFSHFPLLVRAIMLDVSKTLEISMIVTKDPMENWVIEDPPRQLNEKFHFFKTVPNRHHKNAHEAETNREYKNQN